MTKKSNRFWQILQRILTFRRGVKLVDAIHLAWNEHNDGEFRARLRLLDRDVILRRNTSDVSCFEKVFVKKEYEAPLPFCEISPKLIIDGGANIGMATLYFLSQFPSAHIVAIEPDSTNFSVLQRNCAGLKNVTLINAAIWPEQRALSVKTSEKGKWASWVSESTAQEERSVPVTAITIPEILQKIGARKVDLLKLDIEGAELELFSRGTDVWLENVDLLVIELHDRFLPGCARTFYSAIGRHSYHQEIAGENVFIQFRES